jgi:hypothetical protein
MCAPLFAQVTNLGGLAGCTSHGAHGGAPSGGSAAAAAASMALACPVRSVGMLDLHGRRQTSWTRLDESVSPGASALRLAEPVDWLVGAQVLITPTELGTKEEVRRVAGVEDDGHTLLLDRPLTFAHSGAWHWHDDHEQPSDLRAAVSLLDRNIVIQGDDASLERGSAFMYGAHVGAFHGGVMRVENVEFRRTGQAANMVRRAARRGHTFSPARARWAARLVARGFCHRCTAGARRCWRVAPHPLTALRRARRCARLPRTSLRAGPVQHPLAPPRARGPHRRRARQGVRPQLLDPPHLPARCRRALD